MIGKATVGSALVFRDLLNAEGIRSKALTVRSGAWGGKPRAGLSVYHGTSTNYAFNANNKNT